MIKSIIWGAVRAIKYVFYVPLMLGASIAYFIVCPRVKALIKADIDAFYRIEIHEQKSILLHGILSPYGRLQGFQECVLLQTVVSGYFDKVDSKA